MQTILNADGEIRIPAEVRAEDKLLPGEKLEFTRIEPGRYEVRKAARPHGKKERKLIDILRACPVKGFFVPADRTETTDSIQPPKFA